eukprot:jgi/Tetstr1/421844/TSEL_012744.t1
MQLTAQKEDMATTELAPNLLIKGKYVRGVVTCKDCMRPRCLYSLTHPRNMEPAATMVDGKKVHPSVTEKAECKQYALQNFHAAAEHNSFLCGMQPFDDDHPLHGVLVTRSNITCGSPVEFEYYSTQTKRATWFDATTCAWCAGVHGEALTGAQFGTPSFLPLAFFELDLPASPAGSAGPVPASFSPSVVASAAPRVGSVSPSAVASSALGAEPGEDAGPPIASCAGSAMAATPPYHSRAVAVRPGR